MSRVVEDYLKGVFAFVAVGVVTVAVGTLIIVIHTLVASLAN
jgi:hypothetical protein